MRGPRETLILPAESASTPLPHKLQRMGRPTLARLVALLCATYYAYYLWWRCTETLNPDAMAFSLLLLGAEAYGLLTFSLFAFMVWDVRYRSRFRLQPGCAVDIFVPTYNEDLALLEATLTGCNAITYPHTT